MATSASTNSTTAPPSSSAITDAQLVHTFPRHDTIKLDGDNFEQWRQHIRLIIDGYNLTRLLNGTLSFPLRFVQSFDGSLVENLAASAYV